jgi:cytochrome b561
MEVDFDPQNLEHWGLLLLFIGAIPIGFWMVEREERRESRERKRR